MTRTLLITLAAAAALAGCNKENHTIVAGDNAANDTYVAPKVPVDLPPSIVASKVYRCADNNVVYVSWLSDNKSATIRTVENGAPTALSAPAPGQTMTAPGGYALAGTAADSVAKIAVPGHSLQSCKA